jgi:hypothetical protein
VPFSVSSLFRQEETFVGVTEGYTNLTIPSGGLNFATAFAGILCLHTAFTSMILWEQRCQNSLMLESDE